MEIKQLPRTTESRMEELKLTQVTNEMKNIPPPDLRPPELEDLTHFSIDLKWGKVVDLEFLQRGQTEGHQRKYDNIVNKLVKKSDSGYYSLKDASNYYYTLQMEDAKKGWVVLYIGKGRKFFYDNLKCNTAYTFRVRASNDFVNGAWSDQVTFFTDLEPTTGYDIHRAIRFDDIKSLKALLAKNIPTILDVPNKIGHTPLMVACLRGLDDIVQLLLDHGADVNAVNDSGKNCMMLIAFSGNIRMAEILYKNGASLNTQDKSGCSILHAAVDGGHPEMVEWVIQHGGDVHLRDYVKGWTPLLRTAALSGNGTVAKILLRAGAKINDRDVDGKTALMIAACNNYSSFVEELLKHGADVKQKSRYGKTALDMAVALGRRSTTELLTSIVPKDEQLIASK